VMTMKLAGDGPSVSLHVSGCRVPATTTTPARRALMVQLSWQACCVCHREPESIHATLVDVYGIGTVHLVTLQRSTEPAERCVHRGRSRKRVSDLQPETPHSGWSSWRMPVQVPALVQVYGTKLNTISARHVQHAAPSTRGAELTIVDGAGSEAANVARRHKCQSRPQLPHMDSEVVQRLGSELVQHLENHHRERRRAELNPQHLTPPLTN
jgi:hypothetical protein